MFRSIILALALLAFAPVSASAEGLVAKLQRLATQAAASNPFTAPTASGVTMTTTTALDATLTNGILPSVGSSAFAAHGGTPRAYGNGFWAFPVSDLAPETGANLSSYFPDTPTIEALGWEVEWMTDAPLQEIRMLGYQGAGSNFRVIVDGRYVTKAATTFAQSGTSYVKLDFGGVRKMRKIQFRSMMGNLFGGVYVDPASALQKPDQSDVIKVAVTGDSYTERMGIPGSSELPDDMWAHVLAHFMGWRDVRQVAVGGTGYVNNAGTRSNIAAQIPRWIGIKPDVVVFAAGYNDDAASITPNALADFKAVRAGAPTAPIFVLGPWAGSGGQTQGLWDKENAIKAAFDQWADPNSYWIPQDQIAQPWLTGTGHVGAPNGTGNSDTYISDDGIHPSVAGHEYLGQRAASAFAPVIASLKAGSAGCYAWGGTLGQGTGLQRFYDTVQACLAQGFDTVRVTPGPTAIDNFTIQGCLGPNDTMTCYARAMFASSAWDNPGLKRVMLTTIDRTCANAAPNNNDGCLTSSLLSTNKAAIEKEYTDLFAYLNQRFAGRNIEFWLSNWEGDSFVYCGAADRYSQGGDFTASCDAARAANGQTKQQRLSAFMTWLSYKDEAIASFTAANPGFKITHAPEFNAYALFQNGCNGACTAGLPSPDSVLGAIQAAGGRQYCSYSSYDSQGPADGGYLTAVQQMLGICHNLVIGEAGYDLAATGASGYALNASVYAALDQIRNLPSVPFVIPWNVANKADGSAKFGMFDTAGRLQLLPLFGPLRPKPQPPVYLR